MVLAVEGLAAENATNGEMVQIRLLGGVEVTVDGGEPIDIGPAKCRLLLASLALSAGSALPVSRLVELVWGDHPPRTAEKTLQSYVTRLRKSLGADAIVRTGAAYRLEVAPDAVDVLRFQDRLAADDPAGALAEWQGPPLAGLDAAGLEPSVAGLIEQWLGAVENDLEALVDRDAAAAVGPLTELTSRHPLREGLWALLMTALYDVGRQAEALSAYQRARHHLVDELGVEPGPRLRDLEAAILGQADELRPAARPTSATGSIPTGTVSFAFSDVEGSTRLWATHREDAAAAIARHERIVQAVTENRDGHVFATAGDSFGVAFHRAGDAVRWAIDVQEAIEAEDWPGEAVIRLRIGMHTGDAEERGDGYYGPAVNIAARIASAGHGGQILLSGATAPLVEGLDLRDLGTVQLDGVVTEVRVHQLGPDDHPPLRSAGLRRGNLPRSPGPLIGRADLLEDVLESLRSAPIVTLVGPGGIGKTRLSLDAARLAGADRADGAWFVELAEVTAPGDVVRAVADVFDVKQPAGRSLLDSLVAALGPKVAVLVFDNCEHVVDGAAELATAVAEGCPSVRILATSREGLGVSDEQLVTVGPLDAAGAGVELFVQRASALDRSFDAAAHHDAVDEICRRLDGVPLAIELAAARTRTLSPQDVVERLDDSFRLLTGGRRRSVERHRTLRATIQWSYDLLSVEEQMLFRRLSIFAGSFDLDAAERVVADADVAHVEVSALLGDLVDRSMVLVEWGAYGRRFRLLETMRQFGAEQLALSGSSARIAERHARYVAEEIADIAVLLGGPSEVDGAARLTELWPNLRAAVDWASAEADIELAKAMVGPVALQTFARRGMGELADWSERILAMADPDDDETIAHGLLWIAFHHVMTHDRAAYRRVEERYGSPDHVLARMAAVAVADDEAETIEVAPEAVAELRRRGDDVTASLFEVFIAGARLGQGRLEEAEEELGELADRFRRSGPPTFLNWTLFMLGAIADFRGDRERADRLYDELMAVKLPPRTNSPNEILESRAAFRLGDERRAFTVLRGYVDELLEAGNMSGAGLISLEFVNMMTATERFAEAARILGYLDCTGMLDLEGPGFRMMVQASSSRVDDEPDALAVRRAVAADGVDDEWALLAMRGMLGELLGRASTDATPPRPSRSR